LGNYLRSFEVDPADLAVKYYPNDDIIGINIPDVAVDFNLTKSC